jgi:hypothetical protein
MTKAVQELVTERAAQVRHFLEWADSCETNGRSLRWDARPDIGAAGKAAALFPKPWWGVVVFTCFGSLKGTQAVKDAFRHPVAPDEAWRRLKTIHLEPGSIGHHRIQPGHKGARQALVSACTYADAFRHILHDDVGFDDRFDSLLALRAPQWRRTTCFDLLLRAGALGIGGRYYAPERAYLAGSTGPSTGFAMIWGQQVTHWNADWCEGVLRWWSNNWDHVCRLVGVVWHGDPYSAADFENALCIYQEQH